MTIDDTLARLRAVQAASRDTYARSVAAEAADEIERLCARVKVLEAPIIEEAKRLAAYVKAAGEAPNDIIADIPFISLKRMSKA